LINIVIINTEFENTIHVRRQNTEENILGKTETWKIRKKLVERIQKCTKKSTGRSLSKKQITLELIRWI